MTKPWATCSLPDLVHEMFLARAAVIAPLLQRLIARCGTRSFNLALAFPPLRQGELVWPSRYTILRIGDRGDALATRNDWAAMELYSTGCIATDPFHTAAQLR